MPGVKRRTHALNVVHRVTFATFVLVPQHASACRGLRNLNLLLLDGLDEDDLLSLPRFLLSELPDSLGDLLVCWNNQAERQLDSE